MAPHGCGSNSGAAATAEIGFPKRNTVRTPSPMPGAPRTAERPATVAADGQREQRDHAGRRPVAAGEQLHAVQHAPADEPAYDGERTQADEALPPPGHGDRQQDAADHAGQHEREVARSEAGAARVLGRTGHHVDDGHGLRRRAAGRPG